MAQNIFVVEDDDEMREMLECLLTSVDYAVQSFACSNDFLDNYNMESGCLITDLRLKGGLSGLGLQQKVLDMQAPLCIVFITGHGNVATAVTAIKQGAESFLTKPFCNQQLLDLLDSAFAKNREDNIYRDQKNHWLKLLYTLTPREIEVYHRIVCGDTSKEIANNLNISQNTVEIHRSKVYKKMQISTLARLVSIAIEYNLFSGSVVVDQ